MKPRHIIINIFSGFAAIVLTIVFLKAHYIDEFIADRSGETGSGWPQVIINDAAIIIGILGIALISVSKNIPYPFALIIRAVTVIAFAVYAIDCFVLTKLYNHLTFDDAHKYVNEAYGFILNEYKNLKDYKTLQVFLIAFCSSAFLIYFLLANINYNIGKRAVTVVFILIVATALISNTLKKDTYVHAWMYKNVIDYNLEIASEGKLYSRDFIQKQPKQNSSPNCNGKAPATPNIIILMVEGLSAYHENWMPNLSKIAANGHHYKNFYANGFTTEDGEISILTGQPPIFAPRTFSQGGGTFFNGFYDLTDTLPQILAMRGYITNFLTSSSLNFGNTGEWAENVGFNFIEGSEFQGYASLPKFIFNSVPDEYLLNRTLEVQNSTAGPTFTFVKTVSSHHPFINPEDQIKSEEKTLRYVDKQIKRFYDQLKAQNFFEDGLLLIVGDHHSMVPLKPLEERNYGIARAPARVPLIALSDNLKPQIINKPFQQTDIANTLLAEVTTATCSDDWRGILWGENKISPKYIIHRRGDNRNIISIFEEHSTINIKLDGDNTRIIDGPHKSIVLDKVNSLRIEKQLKENKGMHNAR